MPPTARAKEDRLYPLQCLRENVRLPKALTPLCPQTAAGVSRFWVLGKVKKWLQSRKSKCQPERAPKRGFYSVFLNTAVQGDQMFLCGTPITIVLKRLSERKGPWLGLVHSRFASVLTNFRRKAGNLAQCFIFSS